MTADDNDATSTTATDQLVSKAALATLRVPSNVEETDPLLCLVASLVHPQQLVVERLEEGSSSSSCELVARKGTLVLRQRNAVLRAICGEVFHHALDHAPWYLLGGSLGATSTAESSSWSNAASDLRAAGKSEGGADGLLASLDASVLNERSFLVDGCGAATLADLDLYFALLETSVEKPSDRPNVERWWNTVQSTAVSMSEAALQDVVAPHPKYLKVSDVAASAEPAFVFYYGDEPEIAPPSPPPPKKGDDKKDGNDKKTSDDKSPNAAAAPKAPTTSSSELTDEQKKAAAEKRAQKKAAKKKNKPAAAPAPAANAELNVSALDIRVGKIVKIWEHETAEKLFCEEVDLGEPTGPRKIASGLRPFYQRTDLENKHVLVLCNLKARSLVGFPSHGMVLCASNADHTAVELVAPPEGTAVGERVAFETYEEGEPESETRMNKKKIFEKLAPDLKTDDQGGVVWKGKKATAGGGQCRAVNGMANAFVG